MTHCELKFPGNGLIYNELEGRIVTSQKVGVLGSSRLMDEMRKLRYGKSFGMPINQVIPKINLQF